MQNNQRKAHLSSLTACSQASMGRPLSPYSKTFSVQAIRRTGCNVQKQKTLRNAWRPEMQEIRSTA
eukprot:scaffold172874_cov15-Tisochrysis_lutea.AAC.1